MITTLFTITMLSGLVSVAYLQSSQAKPVDMSVVGSSGPDGSTINTSSEAAAPSTITAPDVGTPVAPEEEEEEEEETQGPLASSGQDGQDGQDGAPVFAATP